MELDTALKNFASAFAAGENNSGTVQWRPPQAVTEPIPLGAVLGDYYARILLIDRPMVGGTLRLDLFPLDVLESRQHGYRWIRYKGGPVTESPHWNKHWIVIANLDSDAIVVDSSTPAGTVFGTIGSYHCKIADDLASFFQAMAEAMLVEANTYDYEVYDDDCNPLPVFLDEMRAIARRVLGPDGEAGFMEFFFG
ncbi:hypothetical protein [Massilia rubra]|uniref:Knr4/Smi1-like domain-containing protein n=1 Tax=Massilia rubra TaxID=2607910 RepID=A0ABX0LU73_9BURK|nr:hypothetical protein [Massilia rubra]NHZ34954.1 hypothetical protein [Massilia rubra]